MSGTKVKSNETIKYLMIFNFQTFLNLKLRFWKTVLSGSVTYTYTLVFHTIREGNNNYTQIQFIYINVYIRVFTKQWTRIYNFKRYSFCSFSTDVRQFFQEPNNYCRWHFIRLISAGFCRHNIHNILWTNLVDYINGLWTIFFFWRHIETRKA